MDRHGLLRLRLLQDPVVAHPSASMAPMVPSTPLLPLRVCLLSGGESRRMGRDKALLPHPEGGTWLERTLQLLSSLEVPITLFSRHPRHRVLARRLAEPWVAWAAQGKPGPTLAAIAEPPPWEGPLLALHRLMQQHPQQRLLLCPVDMPALTAPVLHQLLRAATAEPAAIHLAHDGQRLQPLLGLYPSDATHRTSLAAAVAAGERRLQGWLAGQCCRAVVLEAAAVWNVNRPEALQRLWGPAGRNPSAAGGGSAPLESSDAIPDLFSAGKDHPASTRA